MSNSVKKTQNKGYYGVSGHSRPSRSVRGDWKRGTGKRVTELLTELYEAKNLV